MARPAAITTCTSRVPSDAAISVKVLSESRPDSKTISTVRVMTTHNTRPMTDTFSICLANSHNPRVPNIRFPFCWGLILLVFGCTRARCGLAPPWTQPETCVTSKMASSKGTMIMEMDSNAGITMLASRVRLGSRAISGIVFSSSWRSSETYPIKNGSKKLKASSPVQAAMSAERGTWPCFAPSLSFFGVGCSVFTDESATSPSRYSTHGIHRGIREACQHRADLRNRNAYEQESQTDLHGEAQNEEVDCGSHSRQQT